MYGLAMNLIVSVSGHPWIINEIQFKKVLNQPNLTIQFWNYESWILTNFFDYIRLLFLTLKMISKNYERYSLEFVVPYLICCEQNDITSNPSI